MDIHALHALTQEYTLLYVEDDDILRAETLKLFSRLFKQVDVAQNGRLGWERYQTKPYDIVITDINMPEMNGVELAQRIKAINPAQPIMVTSAHDESEYFIPLIEAGVNRYILKPINMEKLVVTLTALCQQIQNDQLITAYRHELELTNEALIKSNEELKKLVRILDTKISKPVPVSMPETTQTPQIQTYDDYILDHDMYELHELEEEIESVALTLQMQSCTNPEHIAALGHSFIRYGSILSTYPVFAPLGQTMHEMGKTIARHVTNFCHNVSTLSSMFESFFYVLSKWRTTLFETGTNNPHQYDASLISDMKTIMMILENKQEEIESEVEFF